MNPIDRYSRRRALGHHLESQRRRLVYIARSWCRNTTLAEDLVQETFAKAIRHIDQLRDPQALNAWLFHILHRCWLDHCRLERPSENIEQYSDTTEFCTEQPHESMDIIQRVRAAIAALPLGQREVLSLVDLGGFSYAEVGMILEIPTGTVTSRICRAREALRDQLAPLFEKPAAMPAMRLVRA